MSKLDKKSKFSEVEDDELERNFEFSIKVMRRLLQIIGMWPFASVTYPKIMRILLIVAVWWCLVAFTIPFIMHMFIIVKDYRVRLRLIGPLSFALVNIFKLYTMTVRENQLRECIEWMASDWRSVHKRIESNLMLESATFGKTFAIICGTYMYISGMSYSVLYSFAADPIVVNNRTTRQLAYPNYYVFFDPYDHFRKMAFFYAICGFVKFSITNCVMSISVACVMHVCGQIAVISSNLHNLAAGTFDAAVFGRIIERHLRAITFAKKLERYLNSMCLIELVGCCFNICMLGYYFITERRENSVVVYIYWGLMMSFIFNIFMFCYIGEQLNEKVVYQICTHDLNPKVLSKTHKGQYPNFKCNSIGSVAYNVDWYHLSPKDARNFIMIITSTQYPIVLTAGKMTSLSMTCFSSVLKASFSYLNMLRTVTN